MSRSFDLVLIGGLHPAQRAEARENVLRLDRKSVV